MSEQSIRQQNKARLLLPPAQKESKRKLMQLKEESKFAGGQGRAGSVLVLLNLK